MLPRLSESAGSQRGSGSDLGGSGLGAMLGAAGSLSSLTACRGVGLMGQNLYGA